MTLHILGTLIGGVGLFLIGSELLRRGFEESAGNSLRRILSDFTDSTGKGLIAGFIVSSAVQSATAVIYTLIGFLNSRLLNLHQAVSVVFGANLGKITIVVLLTVLGFKFDMNSYALPLIGFGAFLKIFHKNKSSGLTTALMGFGLIFFAIGIMKGATSSIDKAFDASQLRVEGQFGIFLYMVAGMLVTFVTQSSTSAIVITLSALSGGLLNIENAIALVIGENLGTTSSAVMASMGTNSAAKRLTLSHIVYNVTATLIGITLLEVFHFSGGTKVLINLVNGHNVVAFTLFYCFYILGSLFLLLPLRPKLVGWLESRFLQDKGLGSPKFLDAGLFFKPEEALQALQREILRFGKISGDMFKSAMRWEVQAGWVFVTDISYEENELDRLIEYIHWYGSQLLRKNNTPDAIQAVQKLSMAARHFENVADVSDKITKIKRKIAEPLKDCEIIDILEEWSLKLKKLVAKLEGPLANGATDNLKTLEAEFMEIEEKKRALREQIMIAGVNRELTSGQTILLTDYVDLCRQSVRDQCRGISETWSVETGLKNISSDDESGVFYKTMN